MMRKKEQTFRLYSLIIKKLKKIKMKKLPRKTKKMMRRLIL